MVSANTRIPVKISVIIVSYNSLAVLKPCLESLRNQSLAHDTEIIVVDNASSDGSAGMVARDFPHLRLIANKVNVGYSKGVNLGIREAKGDYFLILNPDTIVGRDSIALMAGFMDKHKEAGITGPKLVFLDGNIQYSCRRFYTWKVLLLRRTFLGKIFKNSSLVRDHLMLDYDHNTLLEVDWMLGACLLVRREAVESVGLMDERFFLYFEDVDWCYRMKQRGWKVYYYPDAVITHGYARESAQTVINRSFLAHAASLVRYYEKWNFIFYLFKKYREVAKLAVFISADVVAFNLAFLSAYYLRVNLHEIFSNPIFPIQTYNKFVFFENLLFIFTYFASGLYKIRRETAYVDELFKIMKAIILASILLMTSTYLSKVRTYSRMIVAFLVPIAVCLDWSIRTILRIFHKKLLALKIDLKRICIIGSMNEAIELEQMLSLQSRLGLDIVGIIDSDRHDSGSAPGTIGALEDLSELVDRYRIQEIVLIPGRVSPEKRAGIVSMGRRKLIDVTILTDYSFMAVHKAEVANLAGKPAIAYYRDTRYPLDRLIKRIFDMCMGSLFLLVSLPFYVVYSTYARLRGGSMIEYRASLGKARSPVNVPEMRRFRRRSSGRKRRLPDFFNAPIFLMVVKGDLSLVGPYPFTAEQTAMLESGQRFRFDVCPGITGFWRIGNEDPASLNDLLAQDADYIRNWSLILDFKILLRTFANMITGRKQNISLSG